MGVGISNYAFLLKKALGPFVWRDRELGGWKMRKGRKSGKMEEILISLVCVWLEVETWRDEESEFV